jgi:hypothetical protein
MKENRVRKHFLGILPWIVLLILTTYSNIHASEDPTFELTVTEGDFLVNICKKYLENSRAWPEIATLNFLKNPDLIYPGQKLLIPVRLLRGIPLTCEVTFLKGDVRARKEPMDHWVPIHLGDRMTQGTSIQTGHESATELTFEDGATFFLRSDTLLKVETSQRKGPVHILQDFFVDVGRIFIRIRGATGIDSRRKIRTPSAVASTRGTEFRVSVDSEGSTRSEVLKGSIEVGARNRSIEVQEKEGTWVKRGQPPLPPRKLLPPPMPFNLKPIYKQIPFQITFEQIKDSPQSRVMVAVDQDNKDVLQEKVIRTGEAMDISDLQDGAYYLFTQSIDTVGVEGPLSEPFVLKLRVNPLPPFIQLPHNDTEFRERSIEIRWLKVEDAASYHIQVAEDRDFTILREEKVGVREESYKTGELGYRTYYFRVRSVAADGYNGDWSSIGSFVVIPPPPSPALEEPETNEKTIQLRWRPLSGIQNFHFQMAKDREFKEILIDEKTDQASILVPKPKPGSYYVRTSSIDSKGYEGEFSRPQSFEIKPPSPPHLERPEVDKKVIHLRWRSSGENMSYHLQLSREETFKTIAVDQKIPANRIDLKKPDARGTYFVRVSSVDADGSEGEFSTAEKVTIKKFPFTEVGVGAGILATIGLILLLAL